MNRKGMNLDEFEKFKKRHQRHAKIELIGRELQISLKNSKGAIVDVITLILNEDMTLNPLQAVDWIISAFQMDYY